MNYNNSVELDFSSQISLAANEKKTLNKPFRTSGGPKKFSVYVKNEKGNVVKVNFGDPNMEIKRDDPARRKSFRARHGCDKNAGPKWKAKYWSCRQWRAGAPVEASVVIESEANKGLWYNIQKKKEKMGKNYKPAQPGDKDYPQKDALKKAQAEEDEWDGETFWDQAELLKIWPDLAKADDISVTDDHEEMLFNAQEAAEMAVTVFDAGIEKMKELIALIKSNPEAAFRSSAPWMLADIALIEHHINNVHSYIVYPREGFASEVVEDTEDDMQEGCAVMNINSKCMHYGSMGIVKAIKDLPDNSGKVITYEVANDGSNYKKGDLLTKTKDQLRKYDPKKYDPSTLSPKVLKQLQKISDEINPPEAEHGKKEGGVVEDSQEFRKRYDQVKW
jgi:hypothetical protein